nr:zinc ribbon domain-containing protein [Planctomycetota bacterium]
PAKECPQCHALIAAGFATCPQCGHAFPPPQAAVHEAVASTAGILTGQPTLTEFAVRDVTYAVHQKRGAPPDAPRTLRVEYEVALGRYQREWICVEHSGYARGKAERWWAARTAQPLPTTAAEACRVARAGALARPTTITVRTVAGEGYERIIDWGFPPTLATPPEPGQDADEPPLEPVAASWTDEEVPW